MGKSSSETLSSCMEEALFLKETGYFVNENMVFIPVPEWPGWKIFEEIAEETIDHIARWEIYFPWGNEHWFVFLRITWPSLPQILLGFISPDEDKILEMILYYHRLVLLDSPLVAGNPSPLCKGIIINDIPTGTLKMAGLGLNCLSN
jgi:hypothetical protein